MIPDPFNPFGALAGTADHLITDGWTRIMLSLWNAGVWLLKLILQLENYLLTPDLGADGPNRSVYQVTLWLGGALMLIMLMIQLGTVAVRRDGKSLSRVLIGAAQYVIVWFGWVGYGIAILAACAALNTAFLQAMFQVDDLGSWDPWAPFTGQDVSNAVIATVLGLLGMLIWLAGIAHLLVMLTRAGALIVLAATTPISAAGLVADVGRGWFWKSFRWFHAAAFSPVLMNLMMGLGIQLATGSVTDITDDAQAAIATALPAVVMILTSTLSPLALFKLLAFTDPGTSSGAAVRAGMAAAGGLGGLLQGAAGGGQGGSGAASQTDENGRASGEEQAEAANSSRMMSAAGTVAAAMGPVGMAVGTALKAFGAIGGAAASLTNDITNQMGVGHNTYQPDWISPGRKPGGGAQDSPADQTDQADGSNSDTPQDEFQSTPPTPTSSPDSAGHPTSTGQTASEDSGPSSSPGSPDTQPSPSPLSGSTQLSPTGGANPASPSPAGASGAGSAGGAAASAAAAAV